MTHTPTPWTTDGELHHNNHAPRNVEILGPDGTARVALCFYGKTDQECIANARLIVQAVNCHADLLAALEEVAEFASIDAEDDDPHASGRRLDKLGDIARATIARSKE